MLNIQIYTLDHKDQRYHTVGDWMYEVNNYLTIGVSKMSNPNYEFLVGLHELIEAKLCESYGISQESVDDWDMKHPNDDNPGGLPNCPYREAHSIAEGFERLMAGYLGVDWIEYERRINSL